MVTAHARERARNQLEAEQVTVDAILTKPVMPGTLVDTCNAALGQRAHVASRAVVRQQSTRADLDALRDARILLVEDNPINQELANALLSRAGAVITIAEHGEQALAALQRQAFDVVLMDCQMPVMDGYEATRRMRQDARWRTLPVIALTAYACNSDLDDALAAGMNDHVSKPIAFDQLLSVLQRWLRANEPAPQPQADD
jgi:CheY-like chemotaxis protein